MSLKDFNFDFNEDIVDDGLIQTEKFVPNKSIERKIGGFENMTDEEIEEFKNSKEYKEYGVDVNEEVITNTKANMHGKSVQEVLGLTKNMKVLRIHIMLFSVTILILKYMKISLLSHQLCRKLLKKENLYCLHLNIFIRIFI